MSLSKQEKKHTRWRRRKEARAPELIAAALELFVERGYSATRLDDVARQAGVSKGTVYLYFKNKEDLFRAVVREMVLPELARVEEQVNHSTGSAEELLRQLVHEWWNRVGNTRLCGIPKLMIAEAGNFPEVASYFVKEAVQGARRIFARVLERGIENGEFRPCNVQYAVRVLVAPVVFAAIWQRSLLPYDTDEYDVHQYLDMHLDTFLNGVLTAPHKDGD